MNEENNNTKAILNAGKTGEFWRIICEDIDKDIKKLETERDSDELASSPSDVYKLAMENIKDRVKHLRDLKEKPNTIILDLDNSEPEEEEEDLDPYEK